MNFIASNGPELMDGFWEKILRKKKHVQLSHEKKNELFRGFVGDESSGITVNHYTDSYKTTQDAIESN